MKNREADISFVPSFLSLFGAVVLLNLPQSVLTTPTVNNTITNVIVTQYLVSIF